MEADGALSAAAFAGGATVVIVARGASFFGARATARGFCATGGTGFGGGAISRGGGAGETLRGASGAAIILTSTGLETISRGVSVRPFANAQMNAAWRSRTPPSPAARRALRGP